MTKVRIIHKFINTLPIQDLLVRTDSLSDHICFILDNETDDVDFSSWTWNLWYKSSLDEGNTIPLNSEYDDNANQILIHWIPDSSISRRGGYLSIQLQGTNDETDPPAKWSTSVASIQIGRNLQE